MPDFYTQYRFKDTNTPVESWEQFINIRVGARLIKDTGEEYQKMSADNVYDKVQRYFLSNEDIDGKYALLHASNIFVDPQYVTAPPIEPYHIVNKEYVDALVDSAQVDLSGFARLDAENIWEEPQICNSEPAQRTHLTNKGYVDDRINEIEFDTTALAKLNSANVFTAPQSVTVESTEPRHLVTKQYVDNTRDSILNNITGFVRADLPNTFTATQTFQYTTIVPTPKTDPEAANKLYVDTKVKETASQLGNYAVLDLENTFEKDQTFRGRLICNTPPTESYHLVNKEYADAIASGIELPENIAYLNKENTWDEIQHFNKSCTVAEPTDDSNPATKYYVDKALKTVNIEEATSEYAGIVRLASTIKDDDTGVPVAKQIREYIENNGTDLTLVAKLNEANDFSEVCTYYKTPIVTIDYSTPSLSAMLKNPQDALAGVNIESEEPDDYPIMYWRISTSYIYPWELPPYEIEYGGELPDYAYFAKSKKSWPHILLGNDVKVGLFPDNDEMPSKAILGFGSYMASYEKDVGGGEYDTVGHLDYMGIMHNEDTLPYPATNIHAALNNVDDAILTGAWFINSPLVTPAVTRINITNTADAYTSSKIKDYVNIIDRVGVFNGSANSALNLMRLLTGLTTITVADNSSDVLIENYNGLSIVLSEQTFNNCTCEGFCTLSLNTVTCKTIKLSHCKCIINGGTFENLIADDCTIVVKGDVSGGMQLSKCNVSLYGSVSGDISAVKGTNISVLNNNQYNLTLTNYSCLDDREYPQNTINKDHTVTIMSRKELQTAEYVTSSLGFKVGFTNNDLKLYSARILTMSETDKVDFTDYEGVVRKNITRENFITIQKEACQAILNMLGV